MSEEEDLDDFTGLTRMVSTSTDGSSAFPKFGRTASRVRLTTAFIKANESARSARDDLDSNTRRRLLVEDVLSSSLAEAFFALVVLADVFFACADIDERAKRNETPGYAQIGTRICLAVYTIELAVAIYAKRVRLLRSNVEILNLIVLVSGYSEVVFDIAGVSVDEFTMLKLLRIVRSFRLVRTIKKFPALRELRKLLNMIGSCFKTLLWSFLACFIAMSIWSMVAVEFVHPLIEEMYHEQGLFHDCADCLQSFSSVMRANLTIFKTVIAGDSWGVVAVPLIEAYPATAIVFVGAELSLLYGLLQLVVAVVVDTAAEFRQKDVIALANEMEADQELDLEFLTKIFDRIDEDGSGELELEELIKGAEAVPEFQSRLRVMDIDKADLEQLFYMIDADKGNSISPEEFKQALSRWLYDSKTAPRFAKYNTSLIIQEQRELKSMMANFARRLDAMVPPESRQSSKTSSRQSSKQRHTPKKGKKHDAAPLQGAAEIDSNSSKTGDESQGTLSNCSESELDTRIAIEKDGGASLGAWVQNGEARVPTNRQEKGLIIGTADPKQGRLPLREIPPGEENLNISFKNLRKDLAKVVRQEQVLTARRHAEVCIGQSVQAALNAVHEASLVAIEQAFRHSISSLRSTEAGVGSVSLPISELEEALIADTQKTTPVSCTPETMGLKEELLVVV